ncbi:DUF7706 family protein [Photorhabdus luminescens]|uniref:DUF7706 family protein n=1 Tax=Photorhabdus luminescens TaxID=29488 RepID=UPI003BB56899
MPVVKEPLSLSAYCPQDHRLIRALVINDEEAYQIKGVVYKLQCVLVYNGYAPLDH